jgi:hypothetical protein
VRRQLLFSTATQGAAADGGGSCSALLHGGASSLSGCGESCLAPPQVGASGLGAGVEAIKKEFRLHVTIKDVEL